MVISYYWANGSKYFNLFEPNSFFVEIDRCLSKGMRLLNDLYTQRVNCRHGLSVLDLTPFFVLGQDRCA